MNKPNLLIFDVDDTIIQWTPKYISWLFNTHYGKFDTHKPDTWFVKPWIDEFNNKAKEFTFREPMRKSIELLLKLKKDYQILFLSACGRGAEHRQKRILDCYIPFNEWQLDVVDSSNEKIETILNISKFYNTFTIDDRIQTVLGLRKLGLSASYNVGDLELLTQEIRRHFNETEDIP